MTDTYTQHAEICARFYECTANAQQVSRFIIEAVQPKSGTNALFIGGMFHIAAALVDAGLNLTCVDYTDEMVALGKLRLPSSRLIKADLKDLPFSEEFELIFVVGRVFTHMISAQDLARALQSCSKSLRSGGKLFADNYEDSRIQSTSYFNGLVEGSVSGGHIVRNSRTEKIGNSPFVVNWIAKYSGTIDGKSFKFEDSMPHRAFSRNEFAQALEAENFRVIKQGDNFDETSFFTLAQKAV